MATGTIKNTNYSDISTDNTLHVNVDISAYTSSNPYIAPCDGYVAAEANSSGYGRIQLYGLNMALSIAPSQWGNMFVKKGTSLYMMSNISRAYFRAFW